MQKVVEAKVGEIKIAKTKGREEEKQEKVKKQENNKGKKSNRRVRNIE